MAPLQGLILIIVWATLAATRAVSWHDDIPYSPLNARQDELPEKPGFCGVSCDIGRCNAGTCGVGVLLATRGLDSWAQTNVSGHSLARRAFSTEHPSTYMPAVFDRTAHDFDYFGEPYHFQGSSEIGGVVKHTEQAVSWQHEFEDQPFQILAAGLHGCTMITLVSKRAVWMVHYWESYSNGAYDENNPRGRDQPVGDTAWNQRVLMHLRGEPVTRPVLSSFESKVTGRAYIRPSATSVGIDPNLFNGDDDDPRLFIMTPVEFGEDGEEQQPGGPAEYAQKMEVIRNAVRRHLGFRGRASIKEVTYTYVRLDHNDPADEALVNNSERGMALFQYDPNGEGGEAWRLFYENACYHSSTPNNQC